MADPSENTNFALVTEIERHIENLLLDNDCVIVPGFGGFMAHHVDAFYDEGSRTFYPPSRTLGFNPKLTMNDSALAQSFADVYDISYPEAVVRVAKEVEKLKKCIEKERRYNMAGLGTIATTEDGKYTFTPCESGILTTRLYGLDAFEINRISEGQCFQPTINVETGTMENNVEEKSSASLEPEHKQAAAFQLQATILHEIAAVFIAVILFALLPSPTGNSDMGKLASYTLDTALLYKIMPKDVTKGAPKITNMPGNISANKTKALSEGMATMQDEKQPKEIATSQQYTIVLASKVPMANAKDYVKKLHKQGYAQAKAIAMESGKGAKVVYGSYSSRNEARTAMNKLTDNIEFADSWIMSVK